MSAEGGGQAEPGEHRSPERGHLGQLVALDPQHAQRERSVLGIDRRTSLELVRSMTFRSGKLLACYRPAT